MKRRAVNGELLSTRALNRALLARQFLLERAARKPAAAIEHLVGLQAQTPASPYVALWSRLRDFDPLALSKLLEQRRAVRLAAMRATLHLLTARDALPVRGAVQPAIDRMFWKGSPYGRRLAGVDLRRVLEIGRAFVEEAPMTIAELRLRLAREFPDHDAASLAYAVQYQVPLVQLPPRGTWGGSGQAICTTAEKWLGRDDRTGPLTIEVLVWRYLAAFGPASAADMQVWSGLQGLREVFESLRPKLRPFLTEQGRELFDLPTAPRPAEAVPAPVRFLPDYDNLTLSHSDRTRVIAKNVRHLFPEYGVPPGMILIDGFVGATWKIVRERSVAALEIHLWNKPSARTRAEVEEEGTALLAFVAADAEKRTVRFRKEPFRSTRATAEPRE